ncbi:DUF971 domain-containing protein [Roseateles violae]|uniref:DUF971 domain-containing protein n=1 Tax=Roseateles violae TaxID=3058042 RepID=A0ABT8DN63_9BURK|nr:DUF971 domain-containing protein [Pelomonas sp. PFR6]MDN3919826.1 DUF971 domain-containing protein [Pelomonas sp. PFR6]
MNATVPLAVDLSPRRLRLQWPEGSAELPATALRAACRCGPCRARALRGEPAADDAVELIHAEPVGRYALQLIFSDGHDRGIYPWTLLQALSV